MKRQRCARRSSFVCRDERFPKSGGSPIAMDLLSPLTNPLLVDMVSEMPLKRRFWSVNAGLVSGYWESHVQGSWIHLGVEDQEYFEKFRMHKYVFNQLHQKYGGTFEKRGNVRVPIDGKKRLAVLLHWLARGGSYETITEIYKVGHSTVCYIAHDLVGVLVRRLVPDVIVFPEGQELQRVISDFETLCCLPQCCGAIDSTFMKINPFHAGLKTLLG